MGRKMKNAPVYFTVCQVQHNPLLSLDSYLPRIQENLRKSGYPDFKHAVRLAFSVTANLAAEGQVIQAPSSEKVTQFHFSNLENTSGFVLAANSLTFCTTVYDTFESFSKEMQRGLEILHEAVGLSYVERLGLRYVDAVVPRPDENLSAYLVAEVLGLPARLPDNQFTYSFAESTLNAVDIGQVVSRTIIQNSPLAFPPDLQAFQLKLPERFRDVTGPHAVLDTDGSLTQRRPFDLKEHQRALDGIHELVVKVFRATITDHARAVWS